MDDTARRRQLARRLLPLLDLTSLGEDDTPERIEAMCAAALAAPALPAAVCVYPEHVTTARRALRGAACHVASVVNFPGGGNDHERVASETRRAIAAGADEIDMVLPYAALLNGEPLLAEAAVRACRDACGEQVSLKLIIESGELRTAALIRQACAIGLKAGVDFLKTSTGKVPVNATPEAANLMLEAIAEHGGTCGFKAAGGIRTLEDAQTYLDIAAARLGVEWITPAHFRIGASALFTEITKASSE
jgi:deoxyribose-phosphate aldolase